MVGDEFNNAEYNEIMQIEDKELFVKKLTEYLYKKQGSKALFCAQSAQQTENLLKLGADVNAKDDLGRTAVMLSKTPEQAEVYIRHGASLEGYKTGSNEIIDEALRNIEKKDKITASKKQHRKGNFKQIFARFFSKSR